MKEEEIKPKDSGNVYFNVKHCPQGTFARFHKYCDDVSKEAGLSYASYPLGLKSLLDNINPIGESQEEKPEVEIKTFGKK